MKWNKLTIETTTAAEDMLSYELQEMGIEGVEIEDHVPLSEEDRKIMYVDLLPDEIAPDDGTAKISCYVDEKDDLDAVVAKIRDKIEELSAFMPMGTGKITFDVTEEEDWINNWKVFFKPFRLDDNIVIKPTWETLTDQKEDDIVIEIDPGTAFGSGSHETTKLCISQLKKYMKKDTELLDVGTGSGILSIIGLKLGAAHAVATDIDPNAIRATEENFEINHVSDGQAAVFQVNILDEKEAAGFYEKNGGKQYDIIVANILADVIIPLSGIVSPLLKEDGVFITSGIINTMEEAVKEAMLSNHFEILEINHMKDWVNITAKKAAAGR
ncbi:MAG: 50S ribosomal protein L11 methyltransferase [Eubacterium sp.]|nr:50S ribosomal protein L11 methyltransferase [Eubacterium sp.]